MGVDLDGDKFKDEGEEFIIWSWNGDYMNLGAGAETGIYQVKDGEIDEYGNYIMENGEYSYLYAEVNREYSVDMTLELYHNSNGDGIFSDDEQLYKHEPDELQWWITGFDPLVQNVKAEDLQAVTTIDFSSFGENKDIMLDSFREFNAGEVEWDIPEKDSGSYIVTLTW